MQHPLESHSKSRQPERLAYRIKDAVAASGLSRSTLYKLIDRAELRAVKIAGRRLILVEDLQAMLNAGAQR